MKLDLGLAAYPHQVTEKLRFADTDQQGHINNAVFATLCEASRVAFLYEPDPPLAPAGSQFVIVKLAIDFLAEMHWPGSIAIGAAVTRIGGSSFTIEQGLYDGARCVATAESVIVLTNKATRRSTPLPDATRVALEALKLKTADDAD